MSGSFITVRVGQLPGKIEEIALNGDRTVSAALSAAGKSTDGFEVRVNGVVTSLDATLTEGAVVLLVKAVKGN